MLSFYVESMIIIGKFMNKLFFFFLNLFFYLNSILAVDFNNLQSIEKDKLNDGLIIVKTFESKQFPNSPWPVVKIFKLVNAEPLEAFAIFSALDYQEKYVPKTLKSKPVKHISSTEVLTEYEIQIPFPLPNALHVHGSLLKQIPNGYEINWYRVSSNSTEEAQGYARFTKYKNMTLMEYQSFIIPKSIFGSLVKKMMISDVADTVTAIARHIEKLKKENDPILLKYTKLTQDSFNGIKIYQAEIEKQK